MATTPRDPEPETLPPQPPPPSQDSVPECPTADSAGSDVCGADRPETYDVDADEHRPSDESDGAELEHPDLHAEAERLAKENPADADNYRAMAGAMAAEAEGDVVSYDPADEADLLTLHEIFTAEATCQHLLYLVGPGSVQSDLTAAPEDRDYVLLSNDEKLNTRTKAEGRRFYARGGLRAKLAAFYIAESQLQPPDTPSSDDSSGGEDSAEDGDVGSVENDVECCAETCDVGDDSGGADATTAAAAATSSFYMQPARVLLNSEVQSRRLVGTERTVTIGKDGPVGIGTARLAALMGYGMARETLTTRRDQFLDWIFHHQQQNGLVYARPG